MSGSICCLWLSLLSPCEITRHRNCGKPPGETEVHADTSLVTRLLDIIFIMAHFILFNKVVADICQILLDSTMMLVDILDGILRGSF